MLRRRNYVTPTSYLELILTFKNLLKEKRNEVKQLQFRYLNGLEKLKFAASQASPLTFLTCCAPRLSVKRFFIRPSGGDHARGADRAAASADQDFSRNGRHHDQDRQRFG